jgi:hypothetical protein
MEDPARLIGTADPAWASDFDYDGMLFTLNDLREHLAPPTNHHKSIPWRSVTGWVPLVTKI